MQDDHQINRLEMECDELCLRILARRQPVASDLRFIAMGLKLVTDIERLGDLTVNICERVLELNQEPPLDPNYLALTAMSEAAQNMVRDALDAFVNSLMAPVSGNVKLKLYKGNVIVAGRTSPNTLYRPDLASFTMGASYNQRDAEGFINIFGLPLKVHALTRKK